MEQYNRFSGGVENVIDLFVRLLGTAGLKFELYQRSLRRLPCLMEMGYYMLKKGTR